MRIPSFAIAATLGLLVGLVASGCGSDDEDNTNPGGSGGATGGTGGMTGGTGGMTGGTGGATGGTGGATGGTGGATGGTGGATGGTAGDAGSAGDAGAGGSNCVEISLADFEAYDDNNLLASVTPELGTAEEDLAVIEFWEWDNYEHVPGTFDLSQSPNDNYEACTHCVVVYEDDSGKTYFQRSGTIEMTAISSPPAGIFTGTLTNVELEEVTIDSNFVSTPVPGGGCLRIVAASFDTDNTGDACTAHTDCLPNICDPGTLTCQPPQCSSTTACTSADDVCWAGAVCMPGCVPFDANNACDPTTDTCVINDMDLSEGYCQTPGTAAVGATCTPYQANSTGCVANAFCEQVATSTFACVEQCNFFAASAACSLGTQYCSYGGWCWTGTPKAIALGGACVAADQYADCGLENGIARGMCVNTTDPDLTTGMTCAKWCRVGNNADCNSGETCEDVVGGSIGFCVAAP
jgi:hypothetical protein